MNSRIVTGHLIHSRRKPTEHSFIYPTFTLVLDLDELTELAAKIPFFSYNRRNILAIHDSDYLHGAEGSIKERLLSYLRAQGVTEEVSRVELVTTPRYFNYVFNPVNFYYCYAENSETEDSEVVATVAEVNNTFGESHLYILPCQAAQRRAGRITHNDQKAFHVSPFFGVEGDYDFSFSNMPNRLDIRVNLRHEKDTVLYSRIYGQTKALSTGALARTLLQFPLSAALTFPRILWQAKKLYFLKKLPVFDKPIPASPMTIRQAPPSTIERISKALVFFHFSKIKNGELIVELPNGEKRNFGDAHTGLRAEICIKSYNFFTRLVKSGDIGFGESFTAGEWDTSDLTKVIEVFVENQDHNDDRGFLVSTVGRLANTVFHRSNKNSPVGSRKNIQAHYDLSNSFFRLFLDESMTYSCARYHSSRDSLEEAQENKLNSMIEKARITSEDHVLEIGCGWGSFAIAAAKRAGCRVTSVTISEEQYRLATERVREEGLEDRIDVQLCDYRKINGTYDKIVSIEMVEAVGHEFLGGFFQTCERLLKPNGLLAMQVITIPDQRYEAYRRNCDWIQKYIFPGGLLPSLTSLSESVTKNSHFVLEDLENIGTHYAKTLRDWRERFIGALPQLSALGYDENFVRTWNYYFAYCEAGFSTRTLNTLQLVYTRPNNKTLPLV